MATLAVAPKKKRVLPVENAGWLVENIKMRYSPAPFGDSMTNKSTLLLACVAVALAFSITTVSLSQNPAASPAKRYDPTEGVSRTALKNGMTLLVKERHDRPIAVTLIAYRVGSRNEQLGLTGLSHYLEHMLFKGTDKYRKGEIDLITLKNGGENNAFTTSDYTGYWFKFASDRWETALEIEANRMRNSKFKLEEFDPEKQVVIEELQGNIDGPWEALSQAVWAAAFTQHPYHSPVIGWLQDVKRATRDDMKAYYDRWYHPRNATLIVVGDVKTAEVVSKAEKLFGRIPAGPNIPALRVTEPPQSGERRVVVKKETELERLMIVYRTPPVAHKDSYAIEVLDAIFSTGKTSRLYKRLYEQDQSVTSFWAYYDERIDPALMVISAELKEGSKLSEVERSIKEEVERFSAVPVTQEELARAKQLLESSYVMSNESLMSQAELLASAEMQVAGQRADEAGRGQRYLADYLHNIHSVTAADVRSVAKRYLNEDNRTVGTLVNGVKAAESASEEKSEAKSDEILPKRQAGGETTAKATKPENRAMKPSVPQAKLSVERVVLPNGMVLLLSENHMTPTVSFAAVVKAGSRYETGQEAGLASLVGDLLEDGTQKRSAQEIAEAIEAVGGELSSGGGYSRSSVNARVLSKDFDLALDLVADLLMGAIFPEDRVKMAIDRRIGQIKSRKENPSVLASDIFSELIYPSHPAGRPVMGFESTVGKLGRGQMVAFYRRFYRPDNTLLAVVGDFDAKVARRKIEKAFADWKSDGKLAPPQIPDIARQTKPQEKTVQIAKEQVNIYVGHLGIERTNPDFYALQVLDTILGSSPGFTSRIPRILRDQEGLAYSAYSSIAGSAGVDPGRLVAYIGCSPENASRALDGLKREIRRVVSEPVTAEELSDAKAYLTGSYILGLETNSQIAGAMIDAELFGLGFDFLERYPRLIQAVTLGDIARVAKKYISPDALTTVIVGPTDRIKTNSNR